MKKILVLVVMLFVVTTTTFAQLGKMYADYWVVGEHDINGSGYSDWQYNPGSWIKIEENTNDVIIYWVSDDSRLYYTLDANQTRSTDDTFYIYGYDHNGKYVRVRFTENGKHWDIYWDEMLSGLSLGFRLN